MSFLVGKCFKLVQKLMKLARGQIDPSSITLILLFVK